MTDTSNTLAIRLRTSQHHLLLSFRTEVADTLEAAGIREAKLREALDIAEISMANKRCASGHKIARNECRQALKDTAP